MLQRLGFLVALIFLIAANTLYAQDASDDVIYTDNNNTSTVDSTSTSTTTVRSPPPSAISLPQSILLTLTFVLQV